MFKMSVMKTGSTRVVWKEFTDKPPVCNPNPNPFHKIHHCFGVKEKISVSVENLLGSLLVKCRDGGQLVFSQSQRIPTVTTKEQDVPVLKQHE